MSANTDKLSKQIGIILAAIGRPFDPVSAGANAETIAAVAAYLDSAGTTDVRDLAHYRDDAAALSFFLDTRTAHIYPNPFGSGVNDGDLPANVLLLVETRWEFLRVSLVFSGDGFPIFYSQNEKKTSGWSDFLGGVLFLASVTVGAAFPALASTIGNAVMGASLAAQYPAVATAIGQVAVNTALNGGDVQSAVTSALSAGVGSGVGGFVASATDSTIVGAATAAATRAAIVGGNIESAALQSLATSGVTAAGSLVFTPAPQPPGVYDMQLSDSWGNDDAAAALAQSIIDESNPFPLVDDAGNLDLTQLDTSNGYHDPVWSVNGSAEGATVAMPGANMPPVSPGGIVASANGANLTSLALAALKTLTVWQSAGQPPIRTSNATVIANRDGTLTNAITGAKTVMAPGTPYLTADGSLVTNNGNGSYTLVSSGGAVSQGAYTGTSIFGNLGLNMAGVSTPLLLGGGALVLFLLLSGGRRN